MSRYAEQSLDAVDEPVALVTGSAPAEARPMDAAAYEARGVPAAEAPLVARLAAALADDIERAGAGSLSDATTLLRYLRARDGAVAEAAAMWRASAVWRAAHVATALRECGAFRVGGDAALDGAPVGGGGEGGAAEPRWSWRQFRDGADAPTPRGALCVRHGHALRLDAPVATDGAPVLVWRIGAFDLAGVAREGLEDALTMRQVAHLEDALQAARALSCARKRLVRCRIVLDLAGISLFSTLSRVSVIKGISAVGKSYFPEVTASVTLVNAPFGFETLWKAVSLFLNERMRAKVKIVGGDFADALRTHAMIADLRALPKSLGGDADDWGVPTPVPRGAGRAVDPDRPFLRDGPPPDPDALYRK